MLELPVALDALGSVPSVSRFYWQLGRADTPSEASLTMSFLLPSPICLAAVFLTESLFSYLPLILLFEALQTHFRFYSQYEISGEM